MCPVLSTAHYWSVLLLPSTIILKAPVSLEASLTSFSFSQKKHEAWNPYLSYRGIAEPNTWCAVSNQLPKLTFFSIITVINWWQLNTKHLISRKELRLTSGVEWMSNWHGSTRKKHWVPACLSGLIKLASMPPTPSWSTRKRTWVSF